MPRFVVIEPSGVYGIFDRAVDIFDSSLEAVQQQLRGANAGGHATATALGVAEAFSALSLRTRAAFLAAVVLSLARRVFTWLVARRLVKRHESALRKVD